MAHGTVRIFALAKCCKAKQPFHLFRAIMLQFLLADINRKVELSCLALNTYLVNGQCLPGPPFPEIEINTFHNSALFSPTVWSRSGNALNSVHRVLCMGTPRYLQMILLVFCRLFPPINPLHTDSKKISKTY